MKRIGTILAVLVVMAAGTCLAGGIWNQNDQTIYSNWKFEGDYTLISGATFTFNSGSTVDINGTLTLSAATFDGNVTLDDGSGASPTLTFQDGTNETGVFQKADAGFVTLTTVAGDGFNVLVGNHKVGDGTPDVTLNGEDAYIEGTAEVDGNIRLDGAIDANSTLNLQGAATFQSTIASGAITSTAGIAGTTGLFSSTVTANALASTTTVTGASATFTGQMQSATTNITGTATANAASITGAVNAGSVASTGAVSGTAGTFSGTVTGNAGDYTGDVACGTLTSAGAVSGTSITGSGTITGNAGDYTGDVACGTLTSAGAVSGTTGTFSSTVTGNAGTFTNAVSAATGDFTGATIQLSATMGVAIGYTSAIQVISGTIIAEGATQDTKETTVAFQDPLSDTTFSVPTNYTDGTVYPIIGLGMDVTAYSATNSTADAQSLTITDGFFSAGKAIRIPFAGTVAGTNAGKQVVLYIDNAIIGTLDIAAATEGDFHGEFIVAEYTDFAHQRVTGFLQTAVAADADADTNVDTTDFNDGGTNVIKLQVISANAGDDAQILYSHAELIQ